MATLQAEVEQHAITGHTENFAQEVLLRGSAMGRGGHPNAALSFCETCANRASGGRSTTLLLIDVLLQFDTWGELGNAAGRNLEDTAGLRVASIAGLALEHGKRSKTDQRDTIAFLQGAGDRVNDDIDGGSGVGFCDSGGGRDFLNQIGLVHSDS